MSFRFLTNPKVRRLNTLSICIESVIKVNVSNVIFYHQIGFLKLNDILYSCSVQICAFKSDTDSCGGDSGGPLTIFDPDINRSIVIGVVSYGAGCADGE